MGPVGFERGTGEILGLTLGLDLAGGTHLVYQAGDEEFKPTAQQMEGLVANIQRRVDSLGVTEPSIQQLGDDRLVIQLPGIEDSDEAQRIIGETAQLDIIERICLDGFAPGDCTNEVPGSFEDRETGLSGADVARTSAGTDQVTNLPILLFELNRSAAGRFADITQRLFETRATTSPDQLAFVLDGNALIAAVVNSAILGGNGQIAGNFSADDVRRLSIQIESGRLPIEITEISSSVVAASLGAESLEDALVAGLVGLGLVLFFMIAYYRMAGLVAALALVIYTTMVLAIFKIIPVTLTLAGLGGFILSLGMAVDANILIFERMKEELRIGRNLQFATQIGFSRAWQSIRDGNISTLLIAIVLFLFAGAANSAVRGFAIVLIIGVSTSMFTAIVITRVLLSVVVSSALKRFPRLFTPEGPRSTPSLPERGA
jgi:preprotein translocase subunit SecD